MAKIKEFHGPNPKNDTNLLDNLILALPDRRMSELHAWAYAERAAEGLHYLHAELGIIHRDLGLQNLLINWDNGWPMVGTWAGL